MSLQTINGVDSNLSVSIKNPEKCPEIAPVNNTSEIEKL